MSHYIPFFSYSLIHCDKHVCIFTLLCGTLTNTDTNYVFTFGVASSCMLYTEEFPEASISFHSPTAAPLPVRVTELTP